VAADEDGTVVASCRQPHKLVTPTADHFGHDALEAWHDGTLKAWQQVAQGLDVRGVCVAAFVPSLAGLDSSNKPVTAGLLYGDIRGRPGNSPKGAQPDTSDRARQPSDNQHSATQPSDTQPNTTLSSDNLHLPPIESGEFLAFLKWMAATHPEVAKFCPAQAVGNAALSGEAVLDTTTAMTTMPVFNGVDWDSQICQQVGISPSQLPRLVAGNDPAAEILASNSASCSQPNSAIPLSGGTIDAFAEQIATGATQTGDVLVVLGATLLTWLVVDSWVEIDDLWTIPHSQPGLALVGGPSNAGGIFMNSLKKILRYHTEHAAAEPAPPSNPDNVPVWLPYIRGERTPLYQRSMRASLHGLSLTHGPEELLRAGHEATGFVIRHCLDLAGGRCQPKRIVATGGGAHSSAWLQAMADATGLPVERSLIPEGAALGAAFLARMTAGLETEVSDISRWRKFGPSFQPDPSWRQACNQRYETFKLAG